MDNEPNDPTRSGSPLPPEHASSVLLSRNEVESLCFKAARGAGMSWGMAEEAGFAAGWLNERGIDGAGATAAHLTAFAGRSWIAVCPDVEAGTWSARGEGPLCPFALGAALSDFAMMTRPALEGDGIAPGSTSYPVLVLPFAASSATALQTAISVSWPGGCVCVRPDGTIAGDVETMQALTQSPLTLTCDNLDGKAWTWTAGRNVERETLQILNGYAMKTTVPPSEKSRADAGSAAGDND